MHKVRTRFAPSPTGYLHVGGIRTALFAWLLAKQADGTFLLRIEDTDRARFVEGAEQHILDSLKWLGIVPDEEPLRQSERLDTYLEWAEKLVASGHAYADPFTAAELDDLRNQAKAEKKPFLFRDHRPDSPPSWHQGIPLRFKSAPKAYKWHDEVMGDLSTDQEAIDDFILIKSDGYPTYNFAHIIDDYLMEITHVIRSQEFLSSVPKYLNLYEALDIAPPKLVTLPFVMAPDGRKKLSKRNGAKDILDYAREGYLSEAMTNFIATLGWNDGTEQEIFTIKELLEKFTLDRVQKSGAKFDEQRLRWINGVHIRELSLEQLYEKTQSFWPKHAKEFSDEYKKQVLSLVKERLKYMAELPELTQFFFEDLPMNHELINNNKHLTNLGEGKLIDLLTKAASTISEGEFTSQALNERLNHLLKETNEKPATLFSLIRIATTGAPASPGLAETLAVLGKERSLKRIDSTIVSLKT